MTQYLSLAVIVLTHQQLSNIYMNFMSGQILILTANNSYLSAAALRVSN